jgi:hypothetical protein
MGGGAPVPSSEPRESKIPEGEKAEASTTKKARQRVAESTDPT